MDLNNQHQFVDTDRKPQATQTVSVIYTSHGTIIIPTQHAHVHAIYIPTYTHSEKNACRKLPAKFAFASTASPKIAGKRD